VQNEMKPDFQCVRAHWIRGFMAFPKGWPGRSVMLMVLVRSESGSRWLHAPVT